jgi:hypothetical protein
VAWIVAEEPAQIVVPPLTAAFGGSSTMMTALPDPLLVQLAFETEVTV